MEDALGRKWQMGTIQLDSQMPSRFGLTYMGPDNQEHSLYVIHRALYGSFERFIGILIEHYGGAFPFWLAPVQIRVIPVGEDHRAAAARLREELAEFRADVDERDETVGRRIRDAELEKIPYVIVYGDKESDGSLAVRKRAGSRRPWALKSSGRSLLPCSSAKQERPRSSPPERLSSGTVEPSRERRGTRAAACSGFCHSRERIEAAW